MARPTLVWLETPGLEGLDPAALAAAAGLELDAGGEVAQAVVNVPAGAAPQALRQRLAATMAEWLDLAALVGAGQADHRQARAISVLAGAGAALAQRQQESLDLEPAPQPLDSVLVWGQGPAAQTAAAQAAGLGHPVLFVSPSDIVDNDAAAQLAQGPSTPASCLPPLVEVTLGISLAALAGAAGDFSATLQGPHGPQVRRFGAVILAPPATPQIADSDLDLTPDLALPLSRLEAAAAKLAGDAWVAILAGVNRPLSAAAFARALEVALRLQARAQTQVAFLFSEARVASQGGERLYRQAREAGVLLMRINPGELGIEDSGKLLRWPDALLGEDLELAPDLIGLAEEALASLPDCLGDLAPGQTWDDLMPEHARLAGGLTARHGLYVLDGEDPLSQAAQAVGDLHQRLRGTDQGLAAAVRRRDCAFCLTCLRACPHGALTWVGHKIVRRPAACQLCGICASLCPMGAIAPLQASQAQLVVQLTASLKATPSPKLVLLACRQSAMNAVADLSRAGRVWPQSLVILPVNCAGRVGEELVLTSLARGAQGVLVAGCHEGNCRSLQGNLRSRASSLWAGEMLAGMGLASARVRFLNMASNQPWALARAIDDLLGEAVKETQACA